MAELTNHGPVPCPKIKFRRRLIHKGSRRDYVYHMPKGTLFVDRKLFLDQFVHVGLKAALAHFRKGTPPAVPEVEIWDRVIVNGRDVAAEFNDESRTLHASAALTRRGLIEIGFAAGLASARRIVHSKNRSDYLCEKINTEAPHCPVCGKVYKLHCRLGDHVEKVHKLHRATLEPLDGTPPDQKPAPAPTKLAPGWEPAAEPRAIKLKCPKCGRWFKNSDALTRHLERVHAIDPRTMKPQREKGGDHAR